MARTFSEQEKAVLLHRGFTPESLALIEQGVASCKVQREAENVIDHARKKFRENVSRGEVFTTFVSMDTFRAFYMQDYAQRMNRLNAIIELLQSKGIFTEEEIESVIERGKKRIQEQEAMSQVQCESVPQAPGGE